MFSKILSGHVEQRGCDFSYTLTNYKMIRIKNDRSLISAPRSILPTPQRIINDPAPIPPPPTPPSRRSSWDRGHAGGPPPGSPAPDHGAVPSGPPATMRTYPRRRPGSHVRRRRKAQGKWPFSPSKADGGGPPHGASPGGTDRMT